MPQDERFEETLHEVLTELVRLLVVLDESPGAVSTHRPVAPAPPGTNRDSANGWRSLTKARTSASAFPASGLMRHERTDARASAGRPTERKGLDISMRSPNG